MATQSSLIATAKPNWSYEEEVSGPKLPLAEAPPGTNSATCFHSFDVRSYVKRYALPATSWYLVRYEIDDKEIRTGLNSPAANYSEDFPI